MGVRKDSTIIIYIQTYARGHDHTIRKKKIRSLEIRKEDVKLPLFVDNMSAFIEMSTESLNH